RVLFRSLGRVPFLIPLSWFLMPVPAFGLALHAFPAQRLCRAAFAASLLVTWDLSLDPAMSYLTSYWTWGEAGPYYGMPLVNLAGWFVTALAIMGLMEGLRAERWVRRLSVRWLAVYYGLVLLMPFGMVVAGGLWGAAAATLGAVGVAAWVVMRRGAGTGRPAPAAREAAPVAVPVAADLADLPALRDFFRRHSRSF